MKRYDADNKNKKRIFEEANKMKRRTKHFRENKIFRYTILQIIKANVVRRYKDQKESRKYQEKKMKIKEKGDKQSEK